MVAVCDRARKEGLREGLSLAEARARVPALCTAPFEHARVDVIEANIIEALLAVSPRIGRAGGLALHAEDGGDFLVEAQSRDDLAKLLTVVHELDLGPVSIGVADGAFAAYCAAAIAPTGVDAIRPKIVPRGADTSFLAPLPAWLLPTAGTFGDPIENGAHDRSIAPMQPSLVALGLHTLGQVAALPLEGTQARFGEEGRRMVALARGVAVPLLATFVPDEEPAVEVDLASMSSDPSGHVDAASEGATTLDAVLFALRAACARLIPPLAARGEGVGEVELRLDDPKGRPTRLLVRPARPEIDPHALFELARATLAGAIDFRIGPPDELGPQRTNIDVVAKLRLSVITRVPIDGAGERLAFARRDAAILPLDVALARLRGRFGSDRVVTPVRREDPRPEERGVFRIAHAVVEGRSRSGQAGAPRHDDDSAPVYERSVEPSPLPSLRERLRMPSQSIGSVILSRLPAVGDTWPIRAVASSPGNPARSKRVAVIEPAERVVSGWWSKPYELVYHWLVANDGTRALFARGAEEGGYRLVGIAD